MIMIYFSKIKYLYIYTFIKYIFEIFYFMIYKYHNFKLNLVISLRIDLKILFKILIMVTIVKKMIVKIRVKFLIDLNNKRVVI